MARVVVFVALCAVVLCCTIVTGTETLDVKLADLQLELQYLKGQLAKCGHGHDEHSHCSSDTVNLGHRLDRLETLMSVVLLRSDINSLRTDQDDVKKHLLQRLAALEEKVEWCLTGSHDDSHPHGARLTYIEQQLLGLTKDFRPIKASHPVGSAKIHKDCKEAFDQGWNTSGIFRISPDNSTQMDVYCEQDLDGGGWTVFQQRLDGSVDFYRDWQGYKRGFGNLNGEFWLGNDNLNLLTRGQDQQLKVALKSPGGEFGYADYTSFWIDDEDEDYKLHVTGFSGANPPGDALGGHNNMKFSAKDRDLDTHPKSCVGMFYGGWWYGACHSSNLNGLYGNTTYAKGLSWRTWMGYHISMERTQMMVRTKPQ